MTSSSRQARPSVGSEPPDNSQQLVARLKEDIACRRIESGIARLNSHSTLLKSMTPGPNEAALAGYLAQWADIGFSGPELVKDILARFAHDTRAGLSLRAYLYLRLAEGWVALAEEACEQAIQHLDLVLALGEEFDDKQSLAIANFWKGRCLRKKGEYDEALVYTLKGRDLAQGLGHSAMAAPMRVLESWLLFQRGKSREATHILQEAESVLRQTDDYVTLGNIQSSYGRIASHDGRYDQAIQHFTRAIKEFKKRDPQHRNLGRTLANIALVKRLLALQLRRKIDADTERRRKAAVRGQQGNGRVPLNYRRSLEQLSQEALAHLDEAAEIYAKHRNHHGAGTVRLNYGYLHLDAGDYERADKEAAAAFELGKDKSDYIIMARARLLQCMIENAKVEDEIGEGANPGYHARHAHVCIQEAIEFAQHTQDRRLLAGAYTWQGLTQCNAFLDDPDAARHSYDSAVALLQRDHSSNEWADLQSLKARILRSGTVDSTLRAWSQGSVGDKSFQQISEEFAELIIPKVWEREGRKVSRVATRLSISPKKVRRILQRAGRSQTSGSRPPKPD